MKNYCKPSMEIVEFSPKEKVLFITISFEVMEQMDALWSDGFYNG